MGEDQSTATKLKQMVTNEVLRQAQHVRHLAVAGFPQHQVEEDFQACSVGHKAEKLTRVLG